MLTEDHAVAMLGNQLSINNQVAPDWLQSEHPYLRAIVIEGTKTQWYRLLSSNKTPLQLELATIWGLLLSATLVRCAGNLPLAVRKLMDYPEKTIVEFDGRNYVLRDLDAISKYELLVGMAASRRICLALFAALMADCNLGWPELYSLYIGQTVLNFFRTDNGLREGGYQRYWAGRADVDHLVDIIRALDYQDPEFKTHIYVQLSGRFAHRD